MNKLLSPDKWINCLSCNNTGIRYIQINPFNFMSEFRIEKCYCQENLKSIYNQSRLAYGIIKSVESYCNDLKKIDPGSGYLNKKDRNIRKGEYIAYDDVFNLITDLQYGLK